MGKKDPRIDAYIKKIRPLCSADSQTAAEANPRRLSRCRRVA